MTKKKKSIRQTGGHYFLILSNRRRRLNFQRQSQETVFYFGTAAAGYGEIFLVREGVPTGERSSLSASVYYPQFNDQYGLSMSIS